MSRFQLEHVAAGEHPAPPFAWIVVGRKPHQIPGEGVFQLRRGQAGEPQHIVTNELGNVQNVRVDGRLGPVGCHGFGLSGHVELSITLIL